MKVTKLAPVEDNEPFQSYCNDENLGVNPLSHVANSISSAYETGPTRTGITLDDYFRRKYKGLYKVFKQR